MSRKLMYLMRRVFHMAPWSVFLEKVWGTWGKKLICWEDIFVGGSGGPNLEDTMNFSEESFGFDAIMD